MTANKQQRCFCPHQSGHWPSPISCSRRLQSAEYSHSNPSSPDCYIWHTGWAASPLWAAEGKRLREASRFISNTMCVIDPPPRCERVVQSFSFCDRYVVLSEGRWIAGMHVCMHVSPLTENVHRFRFKLGYSISDEIISIWFNKAFKIKFYSLIVLTSKSLYHRQPRDMCIWSSGAFTLKKSLSGNYGTLKVVARVTSAVFFGS